MKLIDAEAVEECRKACISEKDVDDMSEIFSMYGDSTRLKIMNALFTHELCVGDLAALLNMSTSAVSHQLSNLKRTKLVRTRKIGKNVFYSMADEHIKNIYLMAFEHVREKRAS
jgi:DNA-binding transcriptional ArsR family regulator